VTVALRRATSAVALLAVALWLGGLVALGAVAAPIVFSIVPLPLSADAMTVVFRRFDRVAMGCAALALVTEAVCALARASFRRIDMARAGVTALAAAAAVFEGTSLSPRIAELHSGGAIRSVAEAGMELARLHDMAEWCGEAEVVLLAVVVVMHVLAFSTPVDVEPAEKIPSGTPR
jgi:hypothetical protein